MAIKDTTFTISAPDVLSHGAVEMLTARIAATCDLKAAATCIAHCLDAMRCDGAVLVDWSGGDIEYVYPLQLAGHDGAVSVLYRSASGAHEYHDVRTLRTGGIAFVPCPLADAEEPSALGALLPGALNKLKSVDYLTEPARIALAQDLRVMARELDKPTMRRLAVGSVDATNGA